MGWKDAPVLPEPASPQGAATGPAEASTRWQRAPAADGVPDLLRHQETSYSGALADTPTSRMPGAAFQKPVEGRGAGFIANLKAGMAADPQTQLRLLAETMFPDDPKAYRRFGYRDGHPVFINADGRLERADSGAASTAGAVLAQTPEMAAGAIGSLATGNPFTGSIIGSVGGRGLKQILSGVLFDEPQTTTGNLAGLAEEAVVATAGAGIGKAATKGVNRAAVRNAEKFDAPLAKQTIERIQQSTGIDLDFAQAGNIRQLRDLKKWAAKYPSDAQEIVEALDAKQLDQVADAITDRLLPRISGTTDAAAQAASVIDGAKHAIELAKLKRSAQVKPLYDAAYTDALDAATVDAMKTDPVLEQALKQVTRQPVYRKELAGVPETSVKTWDLVKRNLDDQIETARRAGENNRARILQDSKDALVSELDAASPKYRAARKAYEAATRAYVSPLQDGLVGVLVKAEGPKAAADIARIAQTDILTDPGVSSRVRAALVNSGHADAWNNLARLSLEKAFQKAARETPGGDVVNLAGKFRQAVVGTPKQKLAMNVALGNGHAAHVFGDLMDAMAMIAKEGRNRGGSDTAWNEAIKQQQAAGALGTAAKLAASPLRSIREGIDQQMLERNARAFAEALTDPEKLARLKELRKLKPSQERAVAMLTVAGIGSYGLGEAAAAVRAPADAMPDSGRDPHRGMP
ncbi:MAG: hypothetical protein VYC42_01645 [Pseudomonadota bacterium]|nr:hypothetical protein [Pseudomonadota bacterium]